MKGITTSLSVYFKLKTNKYVLIPKKEFIIPKHLNIHKKLLKKDWKKLGKDNYLKTGRSFTQIQLTKNGLYSIFLPP